MNENYYITVVMLLLVLDLVYELDFILHGYGRIEKAREWLGKENKDT